MKTLLVIAAALTLSACAGAKQKVPYSRDLQFDVGRTTFQEVIERLGEPNNAERHTDGSRTVKYIHSETRENSDLLVPYIGKFRGSSKDVSIVVSMKFNKGGVLTYFSSVSGVTSSGAAPAKLTSGNAAL
jgi:hypothetical protein